MVIFAVTHFVLHLKLKIIQKFQPNTEDNDMICSIIRNLLSKLEFNL